MTRGANAAPFSGTQHLEAHAMTDYQPALNDRVQLRKPHPCGSDIWGIVRLGADIGLVCEGCGRKVLLERPVFRKRVKKVLPPKTGNEGPGEQAS